MSILTRVDDRLQSRAALAERHPEVTDRRHVLSVRSDSTILAPYTYLDSLVSYENHVWVRKAVTIIADNACALPLTVLRGDEPLTDHPALDLLTRPNDKMASEDLWRWWTTDMLLGGEEGWEIVRSARNKVAEIWPRQPHVFAIEKDPAQVRYYGVRRYEIDDKQGEPYRLSPDEFVHFKFFNPRSPWRGIGVMLALRMAIVIDTFAQAWERFLFSNNARPDYAVITPTGTTTKERDAIENKLLEKYGGPQNAGKPIVLEEAITDIKVLSFRPRDLNELELRKFSRDEIAGGFGVPDILMGFGADTYDTEDKRTAAIRALFSLTIEPLMSFRDGHLTHEFKRLGLLAKNETLATDYSGVAALYENINAEWERAMQQIDRAALTINDWRTSQGEPTYPWGDIPLVDPNRVPITSLLGAAPNKTAAVDPRFDQIAATFERLASVMELAARSQTPAVVSGEASPSLSIRVIDVLERVLDAYARQMQAQRLPDVHIHNEPGQTPDVHVYVPAQSTQPIDLRVVNEVHPAQSDTILLPMPAPIVEIKQAGDTVIVPAPVVNVAAAAPVVNVAAPNPSPVLIQNNVATAPVVERPAAPAPPHTEVIEFVRDEEKRLKFAVRREINEPTDKSEPAG